jgi:hypothetical protein
MIARRDQIAHYVNQQIRSARISTTLRSSRIAIACRRRVCAPGLVAFLSAATERIVSIFQVNYLQPNDPLLAAT